MWEEPRPNTLLTIPTELTENIAKLLSLKDLLNLRLSNYELATRTFDAFADICLTNVVWNHNGAGPERMVRGLRIRPSFSIRVKQLKIDLAESVKDHSYQLRKSLPTIQTLRNLCALEICGITRPCNISWAQIHLPQLTTFTVRDSDTEGLAMGSGPPS